MKTYYSDENTRLNDEIKTLMQQAADTALKTEFSYEFKELAKDNKTVDVELSVSIVDKDVIQELNREYRGIDKVTDVLSFPQYAYADEIATALLSGENDILIGDVVICYDKAVEQAEEFETGIKRELVYLFVHSIFHLFGYDHMDDEEKAEMRAREETVLKAIGLNR